MGYSLDLKNVSIRDYRELLKNQDMLPGRKLLHQDIDANFQAFENAGVHNVAELKAAVSTPQKINVFSAQTQVPYEYLIILKREMGSLEQKPVLLAHFPGVDPAVTKKLSDAGISTSRDYFALSKKLGNIQRIAAVLEVSTRVADELLCLSNLVRLNGVGALAARTFLEAGYRSVEDVANANAEEMLAEVSQVNAANHYYNARLGVKDMQFCIDFAKILRRWENE